MKQKCSTAGEIIIAESDEVKELVLVDVAAEAVMRDTVPLTLNMTTHTCSNCTARHVFKNAHNIFRMRTTDL